MKRFLCILCSLAILFGIIFTAIPASAVQTAPSGSSSKIYFDATSTGWGYYQRICCYLFDFNDGEIILWGSKKGYCTDEGDGIWSLDLDEKGISLYEGGSYYVIFSADWSNGETYPLLLDASCFGDTAYCTGNMIENPVDSNKISCEAKWKNADPSQYGPLLQITSIGNVVGSVCAPSTAPYMMFIDFLTDKLNNARSFSGKDDQTLIDDIAAALGLGKSDVLNAINETRVRIDWDSSKSSLSDGGSSHGGGSESLTDFDRFCNALVYDYADWMKENPGKSDQQLIDMIASEYGMYQDDVERALSLIGAGDVGWSKNHSTLPQGISGKQYEVGTYYLVINYQSGAYVDEHNRMSYDERSGYYYLSHITVNRDDIVEVVQFNEDRTFTVVSQKGLTMPKFNLALFFFRPQKGGYNFGFNYDYEYWSHSGSGSSGAVSSGTVRITGTLDEVEGVRINWEPYGAARYEVFKRENGGWKSLGTIADQTFVDTTAQSGEIIIYSVRALNASGEYTSVFHTYPAMHRYIGTPKITGFEDGGDGVTLSWKGVNGNARYRVYVRDGLLWKAIGDTYDTSFLHRAEEAPAPSEAYSDYGSSDWYNDSYTPSFEDVPAKDGVTYQYRVRCVSYDGYREVGAYDSDPVGHQFNAPESEYILGDVDDDGYVSVLDATRIQKFKASIITENEINLAAADVDGDGYVTVMDATRIQKYKAKLMNLNGTTPYKA